MIVWLARNTAPDDVIATNSEVMVYLYTGRRTVPATQFLPEDYFTAPSVAARAATLRSILQSYRAGVVAVAQNETLDDAARSMTAGQDPTLVLRDSVPGALLFLPVGQTISPPQTPTPGATRPGEER
jgi:hypothetical protein